MEVQHQDGRLDSGNEQPKNCENCSKHVTKAEDTAETGDVTDPHSAEIPCSHGVDHRGSDESLTDTVITNEDALLLPDHVPGITHKTGKESPGHLSGPSPQDSGTNGSSAICTPPTGSTGQRASDSVHLPKCNEHSQSCNNHLPSTAKSQSLKTNARQIQEAAEGDCCVHCVLACLFCEVLSLCSALAQCLACGLECNALCCCAEAGGGLTCCSSEDPCSTLLDCAILEDCCQSSDCLEMCLDCCSICFPA
ncbi:myoD family inhibitor [Electrophorus electricus]|uniref:myoD family inhibitor n=1 Tax=Electrophorus electricus TaxID=8005 RepID=UPI0015D0B47C|nr:myoD family inhibitor [Electrophorus electricus]